MPAYANPHKPAKKKPSTPASAPGKPPPSSAPGTQSADDDKWGHSEATRLGMEASRGSGTSADAMGYFKIAFDMNKNTFTAMNLGVAYMRANKLDEAVEMFNTSKELDKRGENKDLAENIEAIKQHLNYRTKQRNAAKHKQDKTAAVNAILAGGSD
ncbi:hypothetical protein TeGR_g9064 [Tetraparma gracilis]|uniref:Tetratricopeptide repeat protein n=1 Tax=Tetraparma gracilis TaxID=2962635 RepID=A0ABQ6MF96_9STRA|nr:hypothetical protein TeGR_g9064 [Tetraparma gracilis]